MTNNESLIFTHSPQCPWHNCCRFYLLCYLMFHVCHFRSWMYGVIFSSQSKQIVVNQVISHAELTCPFGSLFCIMLWWRAEVGKMCMLQVLCKKKQEGIPVCCAPPATVATTKCQYQWGIGYSGVGRYPRGG